MIARRPAWILLGGLAVLLAGLAWWLVPWDWGPHVSVAATDVFTSTEIAKAKAYRDPVRALSWGSLALTTVVAVVIPGWIYRSRRTLAPLAARPAVATVVLVVAWKLVMLILSLPFALAIRSKRLDAGLTHQSLGGWVHDQAVGFGIDLVTTLVAVGALLWIARRSPRWWFAWAAGGVAALTFAMSYAYPVVVEPLYNHFTSMPAGALRTQLLDLAKQEGVDVHDVLVADASRRTTTLNAYVTGLGSSRRLVVYDTLLDSLPPDQVRSVVAHELGHVKHHDVVIGTSLGAVGTAGGVVVLALILDLGAVRRRTAGASDVGVVPVVLALVAVGSLLSSPAVNVVSRAIEARADRTALDVTQDPDAFEALQRSLALRSLDDPEGPAWSQWAFGSHPTVLQRIGMARGFADP